MATYLPGITDIVPQLQPFRPDFNFFGSILQQKEAQYQQGYKQLSGLYGSLLNSPMLRPGDIQKRDEFFKSVQQNIQKVSEADLSLETNVHTARQIFQPILNDQNIISDMAYTRRYQGEVNLMNETRRSPVTKNNPFNPYWEGAEENLNWWKQDYAGSSDQEALQFDAPRFVPAIDLGSMFQDAVKGMNFKVSSVSFGGGTRGDQFIIKNENGMALAAPLASYMVGVVGSNQQVMDMYGVMASNAQHRWVSSNAPKFGGDMVKTEDAYYNMVTAPIRDQLGKQSKKLGNITKTLDSGVAGAVAQIDKQAPVRADSDVMKQLNSLLNQKTAIDSADGLVKSALTNIDNQNMFSQDRVAKRRNFKYATAAQLLNHDLSKMAYSYGMATATTDIKVNEYAMEEVKFNHSMELEKFRQDYKLEIEAMKLKAKQKYAAPNEYDLSSAFVAGSATPQLDAYKLHQTDMNAFVGKVDANRSELVRATTNELRSYLHSGDAATRNKANYYLNMIWNNDVPDLAKMKDPSKQYDRAMNIMNTKEFQTAFPEMGIKASQYNAAEAQYGAALKGMKNTVKENISNLWTYLQTDPNVKREDLAGMKTLFKEDGTPRNLHEFMQEWKKYGYKGSALDASKFQEDLYEQFSGHYSAGYGVGPEGKKTPVVKPLAYNPNIPVGAGGVASMPISGRWDPTSPGTVTAEALALQQFMGNSSDWGIINTANPTMDYRSAMVTRGGKDPKHLLPILSQAFNDLRKEIVQEGKAERFTGGFTMDLLPTTLNDPNSVGVQINVSPEWFAKWKSNPVNKSSGVNYDDIKNLTIVMPKDKAPAELFSKFEKQPIETILRGGKKVAVTGFPMAITGDDTHPGEILMYYDNLGRLAFEGAILTTNPDGSLNKKGVPVSNFGIDPSASPDQIYARLTQQILPEMTRRNLGIITHPDNPYNRENATITSGRQALEQLLLQRASNEEAPAEEPVDATAGGGY